MIILLIVWQILVFYSKKFMGSLVITAWFLKNIGISILLWSFFQQKLSQY